MQIVFKNKKGETYAPPYFSILFFRGNETKKIPLRAESDIFYDYPSALRVEVYENGTESLSANQITVFDNINN